MATKETVQSVATELGLTIASKFVPFSQSRNKGEKMPSLNWKVTLLVKGREVLTVDYMAGSGHCPSYKPNRYQSSDAAIAVRKECETGKALKFLASSGHMSLGNAINPDLADVLHSLASDADAIDYGNFEEWADSTGMETDSRKAEAIYRACLEIGLKLRAALGEDGLKTLRDAIQDY